MCKVGKWLQDVFFYIVLLFLQVIEIVCYFLGVMWLVQKYLLLYCSEFKKCISENIFNKVVQFMGYEGCLIGYGICGIILMVFNEIGYLKIWVDVQFFYFDFNKVSLFYNYVKYVELCCWMMQDWVDWFDLFEQGEVEVVSVYLIICIDGVLVMVEVEEVVDVIFVMVEFIFFGVLFVVVMFIVVILSSGGIMFQWLFQVLLFLMYVLELEVFVIQCECEEMLIIYEFLSSLLVLLFGKLVGKFKDQINCELKVGKLLFISLGNWGQCVFDW